MSDYRKIWTGNASSNLADCVTFVALPLLAVTLTQDPLEISALSVAYTVPRLLSVLGIGVLVDRVDRRRRHAAGEEQLVGGVEQPGLRRGAQGHGASLDSQK